MENSHNFLRDRNRIFEGKEKAQRNALKDYRIDEKTIRRGQTSN